MSTANTRAYPSAASGAAAPPTVLAYRPRSALMPVLMVPAVLLCGVSWTMGGVPLLTNIGFAWLTAVSLALMVSELACFSQRFGVGALVLLGGSLIWFCEDYFRHWAAADPSHAAFSTGILAKACFYHALFITMMAAGLLLPLGRATKALTWVPEPRNSGFYFWLILLVFAMGIAPYLFFTTEPFYMAIYHQITGGRVGQVGWTIGRSGNLNYNWAAYVFILLEIGQTGGQFAAFYCILIGGSLARKAICWLIWLFWLALAFGSGTRGDVICMVLPVIALVFLKHHARAAGLFRRVSRRAYVYSGIVALLLLVVVQVQALYRDVGFTDVEVAEVMTSKIQGNTMYTESLLAFELIPAQHDFFADIFPGAMALLPIPDVAKDFVITPIPRALWRTKSSGHGSWEWYNHVVTQESGNGTAGTTVGCGPVGQFYMNYGIWGVVEGGLLMGWFMAVAEGALKMAAGRPMPILLSLATLTWLFRCFRGLGFNTLYDVIFFAILFTILVKLEHAMTEAT